MKYQFMVFDEATLKRFWSKVDKRGPDDCWEWKASLNHGGYGQFRLITRCELSHRISAQIAHPNPNGYICVLHSCDNPKCVNPNHLRWGTQLENMQDLKKRGSSKNKTDWWDEKEVEPFPLEPLKVISIDFIAKKDRPIKAIQPKIRRQVAEIIRLLNK